MKKVTGLYCYSENNIRRFVYTYEDSNGNVKYGVTDDVAEAQNLTIDLLRTKGYFTKEIAQKLRQEENIFNFNCKDENDVFAHIKKANKDVRLNEDDFYAVIYDYDDFYDDEDFNVEIEKVGLFTRIKNKIANSRFGKTVKNIRFNKKPKKNNKKFNKKRVFTGAAIGVLSIAAIATGIHLNKSKSPTNDGPKVGITDEIGDLDENIDKATEPKEEEKTAEATEEPQITAEQSSTDYYTYNTEWTQPANSGSNVTSYPGTVDNSMPGFQNPDNIDNSTPPAESETPDDPYGNVSEGEEDNNYQEGEEPDDDYSEEIDVPEGGEDENTNEDDTILDNKYEGKEGAIDILPGDGDYEIDYVDPGAPLPDPSDTANGDYVTSDEELQDTNKGEQPSEITGDENKEEVPVEGQEPIENADTVPVYQDGNITTTNTTATTTTDLETAADRAVEAMANGEAGNIVVNTDGSISFEQDTNTIEAKWLIILKF